MHAWKLITWRSYRANRPRVSGILCIQKRHKMSNCEWYCSSGELNNKVYYCAQSVPEFLRRDLASLIQEGRLLLLPAEIQTSAREEIHDAYNSIWAAKQQESDRFKCKQQIQQPPPVKVSQFQIRNGSMSQVLCHWRHLYRIITFKIRPTCILVSGG